MWHARRAWIGKRWWLYPFARVEWASEWVYYRLRDLALFDLLELAGRCTVLVIAILWVLEADERAKERHYRAWDLINSARGSTGDGGRIDALQDLNRDGVSLAGAPLEQANLREVDLKRAVLMEANLRGADLVRANLSDSNLEFADLSGAILTFATLQGAEIEFANFKDARLDEANLQSAVLAGAKLDEGANLKHANLKSANLLLAEISGAILRGPT